MHHLCVNIVYNVLEHFVDSYVFYHSLASLSKGVNILRESDLNYLFHTRKNLVESSCPLTILVSKLQLSAWAPYFMASMPQIQDVSKRLRHRLIFYELKICEQCKLWKCSNELGINEIIHPLTFRKMHFFIWPLTLIRYVWKNFLLNLTSVTVKISFFYD